MVTKSVAIDAIAYHSSMQHTQYEPKYMMRDVLKAYTGFRCSGTQKGVATGNWGCGVFGGDLHFKSCLQWLAASAAGRKMSYYAFGEGGILTDELPKLAADAMKNKVTCGQLLSALNEYGNSVRTTGHISNPRTFLRNSLNLR